MQEFTRENVETFVRAFTKRPTLEFADIDFRDFMSQARDLKRHGSKHIVPEYDAKWTSLGVVAAVRQVTSEGDNPHVWQVQVKVTDNGFATTKTFRWNTDPAKPLQPRFLTWFTALHTFRNLLDDKVDDEDIVVYSCSGEIGGPDAKNKLKVKTREHVRFWVHGDKYLYYSVHRPNNHRVIVAVEENGETKEFDLDREEK